jgi:hypothetical protein
MSIVYTGTSVVLDESAGLQNFYSSTLASDKDDNDIAATALPSAFSERLAVLGVTEIERAALSGYDGTVGNMGSAVIAYPTSMLSTSLRFTNEEGEALDGALSGLKTAAGEVIYLFTDSANDNVLLGKTAGGDIVFAAYIEESSSGSQGSAKIWMVQLNPLQHPDPLSADEAVNLAELVYISVSQPQDFLLNNGPSGQNLFLMVGTTEVAIVVTGKSPANQSEGSNINSGDTVNTSSGGGPGAIGVNNQMINFGQGVFLTFVTGANADYLIPNLSETEADIEANIDFTGVYSSLAAGFHVVQLQGDKAATVKITAYSTATGSGTLFVDGLAPGSNTQVPIDSVLVYDTMGSLVPSPAVTYNADGSATISNVLQGYRIEYITDTDHQRVLIENVGTERGQAANFDIGQFNLFVSSSETVEVGSRMVFEDDAPSISVAALGDLSVLSTQDRDLMGDDYDEDGAGFEAKFYVQSQSFGFDGPGSESEEWDYSLRLDNANSGLASQGVAITLYLEEGAVIGSTALSALDISSENTIFKIMVDSNGEVSVMQFAQIDHPSKETFSSHGAYGADQLFLGTGKVALVGKATIEDQDGDRAQSSAFIDLGAQIRFDDDGPVVTSIDNLKAPVTATPITGSYNFSWSRDFVDSSLKNTILLLGLSGTAAGDKPITDTNVQFVKVDGDWVVFSFSFKYEPSPISDAQDTASGTVKFNKSDGTFVFELGADLEGAVTYSTSGPLNSFYYDTQGNRFPEIVVQQYGDDFFGVLTGEAAVPGSKNSLIAGDDHSYSEGEMFRNNGVAYVNISTDTLGVNSDTIQAGEVLNFDFFKTNPVSGNAVSDTAERAYVDSLSITLDQLTEGEDIVIILKLFSESLGETTTLLVANSATDYVTEGRYKVVTIDPSHYDSTNYSIYGLQILGSTGGVSGTGQSLSTGTDVELGASGKGYSNTADQDVFKIIKIDVTVATTTAYDASLEFAGKIVDYDGDYSAFSFKVDLDADYAAGMNLDPELAGSLSLDPDIVDATYAV